MHFPPIPVYPVGIDTDYTLYHVHNTTEAIIMTDNPGWAEEITIEPATDNEIWADNGYANLNGELMYYDSVEKQSGKVVKLKRIIRGLNGFSRFNTAGEVIRGFVVAEHHNQLALATIKTESFIGSNFTENEETLDWRIRNLADQPTVFDDFACPDVEFNFSIVEEDVNQGTLISYVLNITGAYGSAVINFGDGTSSTLGSGTHRYAVNAKIDPVVTVINNDCQIVQTPIEREQINAPEPDNPLTPFTIFTPVLPQFPTFVFPSVTFPSVDIIPPPFVQPCIDLSPLNNLPEILFNISANLPQISLGILDIPNIISIVGFPDIPAISFITPVFEPISLIGFTIPSFITFDNGPSFPSEITFGGAPSIPTEISFVNLPSMPQDIVFINSPSIPEVIIFGGDVSIPTEISFVDAPDFPSEITFGPAPSFPDVISFGEFPSIPTDITFNNIPPSLPIEITFNNTPSIPDTITFEGISLPTTISFGPVSIPATINFGPVPSFPSIISFVGASIPSIINIGDFPSIPDIGFDAFPSIPDIGFGNFPSIPDIGFGDFPNIPDIAFGAFPSIPDIGFATPPTFSPITFTDPPEIPENITFTNNPTIPETITFANNPTIPSEISFGNAPFIPTIISFGMAPSIPTLINFGSAPRITVDWGTPPTCSCVIVCPGATPMAMREQSMFGNMGDIEVQYDVAGLPSVISVAIPNKPIRVENSIPSVIRVERPEFRDIRIVGPETPLPSVINIVGPRRDEIPSVISFEMPSLISVKAVGMPSFLKVEFPSDIPMIKLDASDLPSTIRVVGIPETIKIEHTIPDKIKIDWDALAVPKISLEPLEVKVNLAFDKLASGEDDGTRQCFFLTPCK